MPHRKLLFCSVIQGGARARVKRTLLCGSMNVALKTNGDLLHCNRCSETNADLLQFSDTPSSSPIGTTL